MIFGKLSQKATNFVTAHPRITMAAIALGVTFALSFALAAIGGGSGDHLAYATQSISQHNHAGQSIVCC